MPYLNSFAGNLELGEISDRIRKKECHIEAKCIEEGHRDEDSLRGERIAEENIHEKANKENDTTGDEEGRQIDGLQEARLANLVHFRSRCNSLP